MNRTAFWCLMTFLLLSANLTLMESTAHYKTAWTVYDQARVAQPVIWINALTEPVDLGQILPGETKTFDFSVENETADARINEVTMDYHLNLTAGEIPLSMFQFTLEYLEDNQPVGTIMPDANGQYAGQSPMGTLADSHHYRLFVSLPADVILPDSSETVAIGVHLTARQSDQGA